MSIILSSKQTPTDPDRVLPPVPAARAELLHRIVAAGRSDGSIHVLDCPALTARVNDGVWSILPLEQKLLMSEAMAFECAGPARTEKAFIFVRSMLTGKELAHWSESTGFHLE